MDHSLDRRTVVQRDVAAKHIYESGWTLDHLWLITTTALVWMFVSLLPLPPHDLWWHIAAGRTMIEQGALMHTNEWSYAVPRDTPYVYQSWLSELILYGLWRVGDIPLLVLTRSVVITSSFGLVAWYAWRRAANGKAVMLALLAAVLISWDNWSLRPQTLALVPGAVFVVVLGDYATKRTSGRILALLPLAMLLWVNMHGSFVLGGALLALTTLGATIQALGARKARRAAWARVGTLMAAGVATAGAMMINPLGVGIIGYVRDLFGNTTVQTRILEWMPPSSDMRLANPGFWFFLTVMALAVLMAVAPRRPSAIDLCWYCGLGWLAFGSVRHVMWFALALFPLIATQLASLWGTRRPIAWSSKALRIHTVLVCLVGFAMLPWFMPSRYLGSGSEHLYANDGPYPHLLSSTTPVAATTWLEQHPIAGRLWSDMAYSNYVVWRMPQQQIFVDSRIELYPKAVWDDNFAIARADATSLELLDRWDVTHIMIRQSIGAELRDFLVQTPEWCERYHDQESVILARCDAVIGER